MRSNSNRRLVSAGVLLAVLGGTQALAQESATPADAKSRTVEVNPGRAEAVHPGAATLSRLMRPVTIEFNGDQLENVLRFLRDVAGVEMEILWADDRNASGLDKEKSITLNARGLSVLNVLEKVLEQAASGSLTGGASWQLTDNGQLQVGTKDRLNQYRRRSIYDVADLMFEVTDKTQVPEFDLQSAFQQGGGGGGGGGQSPFQTQNQNQQGQAPIDRDEKMRDLQRLITDLVETEQWVDNGGDGASITRWQNTFIINAPDYIHRQIEGYSFWPKTPATTGGNAAKGRYVTLDLRMLNSTPDVPMRQREVTAFVPGR